MTFKTGDRVHHRAAKDSFGSGTILSINEVSGQALVDWDTHRVARVRGPLARSQTHVSLDKLTRLGPGR